MPKQHYRPESFQARDSIGYLIKRSQRLLQECIEHSFENKGCTLQQWVVLMHVRDGLAITVADLCRELHHDSGAMTRLIDQLEERKLIERRRNPQDRRVIELSLTKSGQEFVESLIVIVTEALNTALEDFSRDEVKLMQSLLRKFIGRLEQLVPDAALTVATEQK
ncbi:MAG: MarR family transcriptional regulator [Steroidobacter sp.]